jgi:hypothetical protein
MELTHDSTKSPLLFAFSDGTYKENSTNHGCYMIYGSQPVVFDIDVGVPSGCDWSTYMEAYSLHRCAQSISPDLPYTLYTDCADLVLAYKDMSKPHECIAGMLDWIHNERPHVDVRRIPAHTSGKNESLFTLCNYIVDKVARKRRHGGRNSSSASSSASSGSNGLNSSSRSGNMSRPACPSGPTITFETKDGVDRYYIDGKEHICYLNYNIDINAITPNLKVDVRKLDTEISPRTKKAERNRRKRENQKAGRRLQRAKSHPICMTEDIPAHGPLQRGGSYRDVSENSTSVQIASRDIKKDVHTGTSPRRMN